MAEIRKIKNIVIGSGPSGRLGSLELGKLGEEVLLIEKKYIAGTCLNEGCMVVCALTDISRFLKNYKRFSDTLGFIKGDIEFDYAQAVLKVKETQQKLRYLNELENKGVNNEIIYGEADIKVEDDRIIVSVNVNDENNNPTGKIETFEAENVLIGALYAANLVQLLQGKLQVDGFGVDDVDSVLLLVPVVELQQALVLGRHIFFSVANERRLHQLVAHGVVLL